MGTPKDKAHEGVHRITLDISRSDFEFLRRYVAYRNLLATELGVRLKRIWTSKGMGESLFAQKIEQEIKDLAPIREACGEIPPADDAEAMLAYAKRAAAVLARLDAEDSKTKRK